MVAEFLLDRQVSVVFVVETVVVGVFPIVYGMQQAEPARQSLTHIIQVTNSACWNENDMTWKYYLQLRDEMETYDIIVSSLK